MNKRTIATLTVAGALGLGALGGAALADSPKPTAPVNPPATGTTGPAQDTETHDPAYTGSITVPQTSADGTEAQQSAALAGMAKITAEQASAAALAKFPGATIQKTELEDENGSLVWDVSLTDAKGAKQDVKVDAGNGAILSVQADDGGAEGAEHATEAAESGN